MTEGNVFLSLSQKSPHGRAGYHRDSHVNADCWLSELTITLKKNNELCVAICCYETPPPVECKQTQL